MWKALQSSPTAVLFLDQDAYIYTDLPLTISHLVRLGRDRLITPNEGDESWPGIYGMIDEPITRETSIPDLQTGFDTHPAWITTLFREDILNTGGGWMELGHPNFGPKSSHVAAQRTQSFFREWWALGQRWEGGIYLKKKFPFEQRMLSILFGLRQDIRLRTAMVEDMHYNSPRGQCMAHLYGRPNKINTTVLRDMASLMRKRVLPFMDQLNMRVVHSVMFPFSGASDDNL